MYKLKRVIKNFTSLSPSLQDEVYMDFRDGALERLSIVYKEKKTEGVVFNTAEVIYLIPVSTILSKSDDESEDLDLDNDLIGVEDEG